MRRRYVLYAFTASVAFAATVGQSSLDPDRYLADIKYLASPELKGRATGSPELDKAADYIAAHFKADGLEPIEGKSYLEPFEVTTSAQMGRGNKFEFSVNGDSQNLQVSKEFVPFNFSSSGKGSGGVVFAGYGITAPEYNYDDYAGLDVRGKFVIVLEHEPQEFDASSVFEGKVYTDHAQFYSKAANARSHGARGVILIEDRVHHKTDPEQLEAFGRAEGPADAGILFVQVREAILAPWFRAAGKDVSEVESDIDRDLKPRSFALPGVNVRESVDIERAVKTAHNVAGYLRGETNEYLIIGAHYDHLGLGGQYSLAPSLTGTVHPGADDNASGTAGVLELAQYFSAQRKPKRGILFITFAGEELGLLGSGYYANHPELPIQNAVTMINMDMIGRLRDGKLYIGGVGTGTGLRADLDAVAPRYNLHPDYSDNSGYGSSDHTSFTSKQVPVLFFFSGLHGDYHKPSDTWDKINATGAVEVLQFIADVASRIDSASDRPKFVRVDEKFNPHTGGDVSISSSNSASGYGPYFGSIPDFAEPPTGVRFADIRAGSPAAVAGLKAGDILVHFGSADIRNLYDFTYALRAHKAGDEVEVEVLRGDSRIKAHVKLTERK
jgi:aminopeptidase YwaD